MKPLPPEAMMDAHIFRRSLPMRTRLDQIARALGRIDGLVCADLGLNNGLMSYHLRKMGGSWHTAVTNERAGNSVKAVVEDNVHVLDGGALPFKKKVFDVVIVADLLERVEDPEFFISECHRVMTPDGRLVLSVVNHKSITMIRPLRKLLGSTRKKKGHVTPGYTEAEIFEMLKDGFDLHTMRTYGRFFVELTDTFVQAAALRAEAKGGDWQKRMMRLYSVASFFYFISAQLDMFLFFMRGHYLIASAKRRAWRPRTTPVLSDGRTLTEAVLNRAPR